MIYFQIYNVKRIDTLRMSVYVWNTQDRLYKLQQFFSVISVNHCFTLWILTWKDKNYFRDLDIIQLLGDIHLDIRVCFNGWIE